MTKKTVGRAASAVLVALFPVLAAYATFTNTTGMVLRLVPSKIGTTPKVQDVTGNGLNAQAYGNVVCGTTSNGRHLSGFTTTTSYTVVTNAVSGWNADWTAVAWIRNPDFTRTDALVVMRSGGANSALDGGGGSVAWQVWITLDGRIGIGIQNWSTAATNNLAESVRGPVLNWKADTWYQVAAVSDYTPSGSLRIRNIKVYVTEAGAESVGDCVAELEQSTDAGFATGCNNLVLGAGRRGYYSPMVAGALGGDISETTFFSRCLTTDELAADVHTFAPSYFSTMDFASLYWPLNENGTMPTAVDATTNGLDGITVGDVQGGARSPQGSSYTGFGSTADYLYAVLPDTGWWDHTTRSEVLLWVRRPCPTESSTALLACSMRDVSKPGASHPWRVAVETNGAVSVSMQSWNGRTSKSTGEAYDWGRDWHLVSIRVDKTNLPVVVSTAENVDGTVTTNMESRACHRIRVYAARAAAEGEGAFQLLASGVLQYYNADLEFGGHLVFGSSGSGYYGEFKPASILGAEGRIGEVAVSHGGYFEWDYLLSRLSRYHVRPRGLMFSIR